MPQPNEISQCVNCGSRLPEPGSTLPFSHAVKLRDNPGYCVSCVDVGKVPPSPTPQPSDRLFEGAGICHLCGSQLQGVIYIMLSTGRANPGKCACHPCRDGLGGNDAVDAEITRRISLARPSPETRFYGTMPAILPETLPAGTAWYYDSGNHGTFTRPATLRDGFYYGDSDANPGNVSNCQVSPRRIVWSTVPIQPANPEPAEPPAPRAADPEPGSYRITGIDVAMGPDQTVEIIGFPGGKNYQTMQGATSDADANRRAERIAALSASDHPLDRRAARIAQHRRAFDETSAGLRDAVRHPSDWPGVDEFECVPRVRKIGDV